MISVRLEGVGKSYVPGKTVLEPLELEIKGGELFFLLGPSGCGKSTLLRMIAGFVPPSCGRIYFGERDITDIAPEKRNTAMVFQSYALWPHMTVRENVAFGLETLGVKGAEKDSRINRALEMVQLNDFADRKPPSLSGGQQQRVALARSLVVNPQVLLLDEPLSNLDAKLRDSMRVEIRRICKEAKLTAIYVTHDRKEALSMADRIALLDRGCLQQVGTPREIYRRPANRFVAGFIGDCNLLPGVVAASGLAATAAGEFQVTGAPPAGTGVQLMIRPESIRAGQGACNNFEAAACGESFMGEASSWQLRGDGFTLEWLETDSHPHAEKMTFHVPPENIAVLPEC
jgi:iron(III) transport system ATP-binding protein